MKSMKIARLAFPLSMLILSVAGCGGGGGGSGSTSATQNPVAITESTKMQVAAVALNSDVRSLSAFGASAGGVVSIDSDLRRSRPLVAIVSETLKRINPRATENHELPSAIVRGEPLPCGIQGAPSGSILVSFDDKDGNAEYSSGDTLELTFIQCYDPLGKITSGGKLKFTFTNIVGAPFQQITPWSFTADLHFSGFELRFADQNLLQVNGTMVWTQAKDNADETLIQVSGARLSVKRTDDNILITNYLVKFNDNVRTDEYRQSGTQSVSSSKLGGTFQMDVSEALPLVGIASSFPDSGTIKITGAGSSITLNAVDRINVRIELDSNLDGIVDSSEVIAWSILS